jgi:hypothetical protein
VPTKSRLFRSGHIGKSGGLDFWIWPFSTEQVLKSTVAFVGEADTRDIAALVNNDEMTHRVISLRRGNSVAFGLKWTLGRVL